MAQSKQSTSIDVSAGPGPRIYIDIDDVLSHTAESLVDLLEEQHGRRVEFEALAHFDIGLSFGLGEPEVGQLLDRAHEAEVIERIAPVRGAADALRRWGDRGYEIVLVTGRPPSTEAASRRWLEAARIPHLHLYFVNKYGRDADWEAAHPVITLEDLAAMQFRLCVEDSPDMAAYLSQQLGLTVALMDRPWNRDLSRFSLSGAARQRIVRCRGWEDLMRRFGTP